MTAVTPKAENHRGLERLDSRYVEVASLPWEKTRFDGIEMKTLLHDEESGLHTTLVRMAPGSFLPDHEHVEIEQTFVLEGSLADEEGEATSGNYVWRPAGSRHVAHSPDGALLLAFFLKPNRFFDSGA
jgi:anti-sigma factor ChrR (cupin superfamily)